MELICPGQIPKPMSSAELREILGGPEYIGPVVGVRQEYQVFRTGRGDYVVFSKSNRGSASFHMTFVHSARVEALRQLFPEKGTTSGSLLKERKVAEIFGTKDRAALYFEVLTTLYVLAPSGSSRSRKRGGTSCSLPWRRTRRITACADGGASWASSWRRCRTVSACSSS